MTAVTASVGREEPLAPASTRPPAWRKVLFRAGIVLTALMATVNTINGGSSLLGIQEGPAASPAIARSCSASDCPRCCWRARPGAREGGRS